MLCIMINAECFVHDSLGTITEWTKNKIFSAASISNVQSIKVLVPTLSAMRIFRSTSQNDLLLIMYSAIDVCSQYRFFVVFFVFR